jgi:hypothetical protein
MLIAPSPPDATRPQKRSSDDLKDDESSHDGRTGKKSDGSPPKRIKTMDVRTEVIVGLPVDERDMGRSFWKKRNSEELDDPEAREGGKRLKVGSIANG